MFSPLLAGVLFPFLFIFQSVAGLHNVTIQEDDPRIRYYSDGSWTHVSDLSAKPSLLGCSDGIMQSTVEGSFFELNFTGTAVYLNTISGAKGLFKAFLDDKLFDFELGNTTTARCQIAYSQTGLADVPHRLVILNAGSSSSLLFDSITYTESDPYDYGKPPAGSIPLTNAPMVYVPVRPQSPRVTTSGSWQVIDLTPIGESLFHCADYVFQTSTIGSYIELRFNGTSVEVNTLAEPHSRGSMIMSIDGENEVVDGHGFPKGCKLSWRSKDLSPNFEHVLRVINAGSSIPDEASLVSVVSIKYTTKSDDPSVQNPNNTVPGLRAISPTSSFADVPSPVAIGGAIAAGVFVFGCLGFAFYWMRRERINRAARRLDEEKMIASRKFSENNRKKSSTDLLSDDYQTPQRPKQSQAVIPPVAADTPRSSITLSNLPPGGADDSRPSTQQSGRKVEFLDIPKKDRS